MDFLKRLSVGSYLVIVGIVLAVVALIMAFISGSSLEFPLTAMPIVVTFTIFAIVLVAGAVVVGVMFGEKSWSSIVITAALVAATLLFGLCLYNIFVGRSVLMGGIWFTDLDRGYESAEAALSNGVVSMVFYAIAAVTLSVAAAFKLGKQEA